MQQTSVLPKSVDELVPFLGEPTSWPAPVRFTRCHWSRGNDFMSALRSVARPPTWILSVGSREQVLSAAQSHELRAFLNRAGIAYVEERAEEAPMLMRTRAAAF